MKLIAKTMGVANASEIKVEWDVEPNSFHCPDDLIEVFKKSWLRYQLEEALLVQRLALEEISYSDLFDSVRMKFEDDVRILINVEGLLKKQLRNVDANAVQEYVNRTSGHTQKKTRVA